MPKPTKQIVIDALIKGIEVGKDRGKLLATIGKKWQVSQRTFDRYWKTANEQHMAKQQAIKKEIAIVDKEDAINARKNGLKTKNERLMILQNEVDKCLLDLYPVKGKKPTVFGKVALRKTIKELQSEISKIEGDYAPEKSEVNIRGKLTDDERMRIKNKLLGVNSNK